VTIDLQVTIDKFWCVFMPHSVYRFKKLGTSGITGSSLAKSRDVKLFGFTLVTGLWLGRLSGWRGAPSQPLSKSTPHSIHHDILGLPTKLFYILFQISRKLRKIFAHVMAASVCNVCVLFALLFYMLPLCTTRTYYNSTVQWPKNDWKRRLIL